MSKSHKKMFTSDECTDALMDCSPTSSLDILRGSH